MRFRPWMRWVIGVAVLAILVGIGTRAAIGAVQEPYLVQAVTHDGSATRYALVIVPRDPSTTDLEGIIRQFASKTPGRPITAEFFTDGNAAISFEGGGAPDDPATADKHVGEFIRPQSGSGQGWADAKGAKDSGKTTFQAP